jgi:hypothetical protein
VSWLKFYIHLLDVPRREKKHVGASRYIKNKTGPTGFCKPGWLDGTKYFLFSPGKLGSFCGAWLKIMREEKEASSSLVVTDTSHTEVFRSSLSVAPAKKRERG